MFFFFNYSFFFFLRTMNENRKYYNTKNDEDENKYKSISEYNIIEDDINNFVMIDTMTR